MEGSWGAWAIEIKTSSFGAVDLRGLLEFTRRHRRFRPLVVCDRSQESVATRLGVPATSWQEFLMGGPHGID